MDYFPGDVMAAVTFALAASVMAGVGVYLRVVMSEPWATAWLFGFMPSTLFGVVSLAYWSFVWDELKMRWS